MTVPDIVFDGGPRHGERRTQRELRPVVVPCMRPMPLTIEGPQRPPWRHPLRRLRWSPPPLTEPPPFEQLTYTDTGDVRDGAHVYAIAGWAWFKGPEISEDSPLWRALLDVLDAVPARIRLSGELRWVMDLGWYKRVRREFWLAAHDEDHDDESEWVPSPEDTLTGMRIEVTADGGKPHLENRRYPADFGA